jgi:hypothetical protein
MGKIQIVYPNHSFKLNSHFLDYITIISWLVVLTILKNMKINGKNDITYMKWKIKVRFETTNQIIIPNILASIIPEPIINQIISPL